MVVTLEWLERTHNQVLRVIGSSGVVLCELFRAGDWYGSFPGLPIETQRLCDGDLPPVCARSEAVAVIRKALHDLNEALVLTEVREV